MTQPIPRRIIQTGKSRQLPLVAQAAVNTLRLQNPDYEWLFFDDQDVERFIDTQFPQYRSLFDAFPVRIQKYDFFRYLAVFRLGGFYFDLDVFLASSLEELRDRGCVFPFEELTVQRYLARNYGMDWEVGNYAFGAAPQHPFLHAVIENCVRAQREPRWANEMLREIPRMFRDDFLVLDTTGPGLVSRTLAEFPDAASQVTVLFPKDVCNDADWHCFGNYGIHLHQGSWRGARGYFRRKAGQLWENAVRRQMRQESVARGPERTLAFTPSLARASGVAA